MNRMLAAMLLVGAGVVSNVHAWATDTTFTYQGHLVESGAPANGSYIISYSIWDAASGGSQIGSTFTNAFTNVVDGKFTQNLDFGANAFVTSDRWLLVVVNGTALSPRQALTHTPYAVQTRGMFVNSANNVGIGNTTPNGRLHVTGDGTSTVLRLTNGGSGGTALVAGDVFGTGRAASFYGITSNDLVSVQNDGTGRAAAFGGGDVTILNGSLGIGTTSPAGALDVISNSECSIENTDTSLTTFGLGVKINSSGGFALRASTMGSNSSAIAVYGSTQSTTIGAGVQGIASAGSGTGVGVKGISNSVNGYDFYAGGPGINYGSGSSRRWKHNIEPIAQPLDMLAQLRGVYFDWDNAHGGQHDVGMIAEEVGKVLPEIVGYEANGADAIAMDYSKLTPLLVEAVKALQVEKDAEIAVLHARIAALERRVDDLAAK